MSTLSQQIEPILTLLNIHGGPCLCSWRLVPALVCNLDGPRHVLLLSFFYTQFQANITPPFVPRQKMAPAIYFVARATGYLSID
jgi:hypothetical protein